MRTLYFDCPAGLSGDMTFVADVHGLQHEGGRYTVDCITECA